MAPVIIYEMKKLSIIFLLLNYVCIMSAQKSPGTQQQASIKSNADDPSNFLSRVEIYNELQRYDKKDIYLNQTVVRTVVKIGKRFTTRLDVPYVYNSKNIPENSKQSGLGDISFRLLGYKFFEKPFSAFTASLEVSLNTAETRLLGTGKNMLIPMVSYSKVIPKKKMLFSWVLQQTNSVGGDETRAPISFTKLQVILIKYWSKKTWSTLGPEWYLDYIHGGLSMNLRTRMIYAPIPRLNIWFTPSAGIFGDFIGRYQWSLDIGGRYFLFREMNSKKKP